MEGVSLDDKQRSSQSMMRAGADIHALNTVRKHLSVVKGGRLAAACAGRTLTLAVSDVVGDDLAVIGSGPGVADPSTWRDAADALHHYVQWPSTAVGQGGDAKGTRGDLAETPKPGSARMQQARARVIASRVDAMHGAREAAEQLGYRAVVLAHPITGEARVAARAWFEDARLRSERGGARVS